MIDSKNNFDFLRFVLASIVLYAHSYYLYYGQLYTTSMSYIHTITYGQIDGHFEDIAVNIFFIISGFLITLSFIKKSDIKIFILNRVLRIYPAFIMNLFFITIVVGVLVSTNISEYFVNINYYKLFRSFVNLYIANDALSIFKELPFPNAVNGSLWTLQFEIICYIVIGLLGFMGLLRRKIILLMFAISYGLYMASVYMNYNVLHFIINGAFDFLPRLLSYFLIGSLFYFYSNKIFYTKKSLILAVLLLIIANEMYMLKAYLLFFWAYVGFWFIFNKKIKLNNFAKYGDFSYGMYIYAFPIQQTILFLFKDLSLSFYAFMFLSFIITLTMSILSWKVIESPTLRRFK